MRFQFIVVTLCDGTVRGTDSEDIAHEFAACDDYLVVEPGQGIWFADDMTINQIQKVES